MHRSVLRAGVTALSVAAIGGPALASSKPDLEYGAYLASECRGCHRPQAASGAAIPDLNGMAELTFVTVMRAYREKQLSNPVMQNIAGRFNDDDLAALAAYFASQQTRTTMKP